MRTANFKTDVFYPVAHLLGIDPTQDLNNDDARAWVASINSNVRYAWEIYPWPELNITEERAFRAEWSASTSYLRSNPANINSAPDEVYYVVADAYYRVKSTAVSDPVAGTLPTNTTYFEAIALADLDKYIPPDAAGETPIGEILAVYSSTPRSATVPSFRYGTWPSEYGYDVSSLASGSTAWIRYRVRQSTFSADQWSASTTYAVNDVVYYAADGNCYKALQAGNNHNPASATTYWQLQKMPYVLSEYVKFATAADFAEDMQNSQMWQAKAEALLAREVDKCIEQGQRFFYDINGGCTHRMPLGLSGFWWSVTAPDTWPLIAYA